MGRLRPSGNSRDSGDGEGGLDRDPPHAGDCRRRDLGTQSGFPTADDRESADVWFLQDDYRYALFQVGYLLQKMATGRVSPETFTHGSSAQRTQWFNRGLNSGQ